MGRGGFNQSKESIALADPITEDTASTYEHTKLPGPRWIRLLEPVAHGIHNHTVSPDGPIYCRLVDVQLDDEPEYEALSYSWDNQTPDRAMYVLDDTSNTPEKFLITANCDDAIRELHRCMEWKSGYRLWVDAICINQSDLQERNSQVTMMGDIYRHATIVRVWLGAIVNDSFDDLLSAIRLASNLKSHDRPNLAPLESLEKLARRPYWQRIWTMQELALAKGVVIHIGKDNVRYDTLVVGCHQLFNDKIPHLRIIGHAILAYRLKTGFEDVDELLLVLTAQSKYSSEPRDKIYAVRSLFPIVFKNITVDYDKSVQQVYTEATKAIIEHIGNFTVSFYRSTTDLANIMPSWVVDWSNSEFLADEMFQPHAPTGNATSNARFSFSNDFRTLNAYGQVIDSIEYTGLPLSKKLRCQAMDDDDMAVYDYLLSPECTMDILSLRNWIQFIHNSHSEMPVDQIIIRITQLLDPDNVKYAELYGWLRILATGISLSYCPIEELDADLRRKLSSESEQNVCERFLPGYKGPITGLDVLQKILFNIVLDDKDVARPTFSLHLKIMRHIKGQKLFITSEGFIGTGTGSLEKGDKIMIFEGLDFFMLARNNGSKNYFVGPAYIPSRSVDEVLQNVERLEPIQID